MDIDKIKYAILNCMQSSAFTMKSDLEDRRENPYEQAGSDILIRQSSVALTRVFDELGMNATMYEEAQGFVDQIDDEVEDMDEYQWEQIIDANDFDDAATGKIKELFANMITKLQNG